MAILGAVTLLENRFPTGIDAALLATLALEEGVSQDAAVALAAQVIGRRNEELAMRYGGIWSQTNERMVEYRAGTGSRGKTNKTAELARNRTVRGKEAGHMLPRDDFDDGVDFDDNFERRGNLRKLSRSFDELADNWENAVDEQFITRALTNTEVAVGSSGYSVGWAIGSGGNVPFIPPQYRGKLFDSTHTHYVTSNTSDSGTWATFLADIMKQLRHHGHRGMLTIMVGEDNVDEVVAATGFVDLESPRIIVSAANSNAPVRYIEDQTLADNQGVPGDIFGYFKSSGWGIAEVRRHERIPTGYAFATKSYGVNDMRNGMAVYVESPLGFGLNIEPEYRATPELKLKRVRLLGTHGIGVNDRTNGVAGQIGAGVTSYSNPSIT